MLRRAYRQAVFITAPSMTTPAVTYFQSATSSFRASATIVVLRRRPPLRLTRSWNQRVSAESRLMAQPKPGELDHRCPQSRVAGLRDALLAIDRPALPGRRGKAGISGDLSAVIEVSEEPLRPEDRSELRPDAIDAQQHRRPGPALRFVLRRAARPARPPQP